MSSRGRHIHKLRGHTSPRPGQRLSFHASAARSSGAGEVTADSLPFSKSRQGAPVSTAPGPPVPTALQVGAQVLPQPSGPRPPARPSLPPPPLSQARGSFCLQPQAWPCPRPFAQALPWLASVPPKATPPVGFAGRSPGGTFIFVLIKPGSRPPPASSVPPPDRRGAGDWAPRTGLLAWALEHWPAHVLVLSLLCPAPPAPPRGLRNRGADARRGDQSGLAGQPPAPSAAAMKRDACGSGDQGGAAA